MLDFLSVSLTFYHQVRVTKLTFDLLRIIELLAFRFKFLKRFSLSRSFATNFLKLKRIFSFTETTVGFQFGVDIVLLYLYAASYHQHH